MEEIVVNTKFLTRKDIIEVNDDYKRLRNMAGGLKKKYSKEIFQFPKIPTLFTESLCFYLLKERRILNNFHFDDVFQGGVFNRKENENNKSSDLAIKVDKDKYPVEVKATTTEKGFSSVTENDHGSTVFIYMHFHDYYQKNKPCISVYSIVNLNGDRLEPEKKNLNSLMKDKGIKPQPINIDQLFQEWSTN